ncbi:MFS transporter [Nocardiopsis synnemataformans]|uniref:MFS transporter n=1 Tax=Nocardiopsis synnemataformans TaxID=61305 RepID=UPI003EBDCB7E
MNPRRGILALAFDARLGTIVWGKFFSATAFWMTTVMVGILIYEWTGSALMVALASVFQLVPQFFLAPLSGAWADQGRVVRQVVVGRTLIATGAAGVAAWLTWATASPGIDIAVLLAGCMVSGLGFALGGPPLQSIVPEIVERSELSTAMALNTAPFTVTAVVGPALAVIVASEFGVAAVFWIAVGVHLGFAVAILLARLPSPPRVDADLSVRAGVRYVRSNRKVLVILAVLAGAACAAEPVVTLAPALSDAVGGGRDAVGYITGSFGAGATLGLLSFGLVARWFSSTGLSQLGALCLALGLFVVALAGALPQVLVGCAVAGLGFTLATSTMSSLLQSCVPAHVRGRVMAMWMMAAFGVRPVAAAVAGFLADAAGVPVATVLAAGIALMVALLTWLHSAALEQVERDFAEAGPPRDERPGGLVSPPAPETDCPR